MAAVNITFQGMFYDKVSRVYYENATMVGIAFLSDLHVGGGPMPPGPGGGGSPPGIWGPTDPRPTPPIAFPPGWVGGVPPGGGAGGPPGIWGPTDPRPTPPIHIPPENLPPGVVIPEGHVLVVVYDPATGQYKASTMPKPGPGWTPPSGGNVPQPVTPPPA